MTEEVKTVTHEGQVYEIGKDYLFSLNELDWTYLKLTDIDGGYEKVFCTRRRAWRYIKEIPASESMGTITPAPIELINGEAYMFGYGKALDAVGIYDKQEKRFYFARGRYYGYESCTNIRLMTVAESK